MKRMLQLFALVILLTGLGLWLRGGQNHGWTKTSIAVEQVDPVTDLHFTKDKPGFFPGIDFLAVIGALSGGLLGVSCLVSRKNKPSVTQI